MTDSLFTARVWIGFAIGGLIYNIVAVHVRRILGIKPTWYLYTLAAVLAWLVVAVWLQGRTQADYSTAKPWYEAAIVSLVLTITPLTLATLVATGSEIPRSVASQLWSVALGCIAFGLGLPLASGILILLIHGLVLLAG